MLTLTKSIYYYKKCCYLSVLKCGHPVLEDFDSDMSIKCVRWYKLIGFHIDFQFLKKLHLQERVVDEVKLALKPFYSQRQINKEQYKEIMRKAVPKVG